MVGCTRGHAFNFFKFFFKFIDNSFKDFSKMKFIKTIGFLKKCLQLNMITYFPNRLF